MNNSSSISYLRGSEINPQPASSGNSKHLEDICKLVVRDVSAMLQGMFDGIDDSFFELANNAHSNNEQNRYFEAMREIRIKRKGIEQEFKDSIEIRFSPKFALSNEAQNPHSLANDEELSSLSLVQNDDLEEDVAVSSMATKVSANFQGQLLQFHTRFANLLGASKLEEITPPLAPKAISKAFANACKSLEIEIKEKLIVLKQFDRYVLSNIGLVLDDANKQLISIGIIPNFKTQGIKQPSRQTQAQASTATQTQSEQHLAQQESAQSPVNANNVLPQLQNLLANVRSHNPNSLGHGSFNASIPQNANTKFVSTQDLINLLSAIQDNTNTAPHQQDGQAKIVNIQHELKNKFSQTDSSSPVYPTFKQNDEDLINLVAMLFEFILDDYNLSPPVQVLISRLQIPILKVVIKDSSFFSTPKHPARMLLNILAKSGVSCDHTNTQKDKVFGKISDTVTTIINEYNGDISLFSSLYNEFKSFIEKEEKKSRIVEQRTKESEIGMIKSRLAQKEVEEKLESILNSSSVEIPAIISETLLGGWSRVMFLAKLKDEQEHQWLQTCKIAEDLIWCFQPFTSAQDKQHWIAIAPKLLKNLKSGLDEVSYNSSSLDQCLLDIRSALTNAFKNNSLQTSEKKDKPNSRKESTPKTAIQKQQEEINSKHHKHLELVQSIEPGSWVEFLQSGTKVRCKLSAIVEDSESYIFVNRVGLKVKEISKMDLVKLFASESATALTQTPIIDRALHALKTSLQQKASA